jgi:hypothetical protein
MEHDEKICPLCAETIKAEAVRCKHCHADISGKAHVEAVKPEGMGFAQKAFIVLILGVVAIFAIGAFSTPSEEDLAIDHARRAIEMCRENEASYQGPAGARQIISGACRKLESDFATRFSRTP